MANRKFDTLRTQGPERIIIQGSWAPAGAGAVTARKGKGFTVARTGVGEYTVTFTDKFKDLESIVPMLQLNALADTAIQFGALDAAAKTLIVRVVTGGAAADIAANANNRVGFVAVFRNTERE